MTARDKEKHAESVDENSSSLLRSIYDLEWSMNQPVGHIPEVSESRPITNAAGVEMLGQLINKLIYKVCKHAHFIVLVWSVSVCVQLFIIASPT